MRRTGDWLNTKIPSICLRRGSATRLHDFPVIGEGKEDADGFAFVTYVVELDPAGARSDLLKRKGIGRNGIELGPPIFLQLAPAPAEVPLVAFTPKACILRIQIEKRLDIAVAAGVEPVDDDGHLIEVLPLV